MAKTIHITKQYELFKHLTGNRAVRENRKNAIIKSVNKVGYITSPIIVNEKYEVIDGQARIEAFQELRIPVEYIIHEGIGLKECRAMNVDQSNWTLLDFVDSYAESGNINYQRLKAFLGAWRSYGLAVVIYASTGERIDSSSIKEGTFCFSEDDVVEGQRSLEYLNSMHKTLSKIKGGKVSLHNAVLFAAFQPEIDRDRLRDKIVENEGNFSAIANEEHAIEQLEEIYNLRIRGEKVYLTMLFDKYKRSKKTKAPSLTPNIDITPDGRYHARMVIGGKRREVTAMTPGGCLRKLEKLKKEKELQEA